MTLEKHRVAIEPKAIPALYSVCKGFRVFGAVS
jgi:hypothetical protein